jgi:hypothetical protein
MTPGGCLPESAICPQPFHVLGSNRCWNGDFEFFDCTGWAKNPIMAWGLSRAQPAHLDQGESPGPVRHLSLYVASDLHEHVEQAAAAAGVKAAPWLRHMVRQITITDFPASWQEATPRERFHDSRTYTERFMLRLDESSQTTLQQLVTHFDTSAAEMIRHLIAQAAPEDFPPSWQMRAQERHAHQPRQ